MATREYITSNVVPPEEQYAVKEWGNRPWNKAIQFVVEHVILRAPVYDLLDAMNFGQEYLPYSIQNNETPMETRSHHIITDAATLSVAEKQLQNPSLRRKQRIRTQATALAVVDKINARIGMADEAEQPFLMQIALDTRDITTLYINEGSPKPAGRNFPYVSQEIRIRSRSLQRNFPSQFNMVKR